MTTLLKFSTAHSVHEARVDEDVEAVDTYTFPEVITLDEKSYADLEHHVKNPRTPTPALIAIFKR